MLTALALLASPAAAAQQCHVTFRVEGAEPLGGLELGVDYSVAVGTFDGTDDGVKCTGLAPASWQLARDDDADAELNLGLISAAGVPLPQDVWRCDFTAADAAPVAGDFLVTVDEALTPLSEPTSVEGSVSDIFCDPSAVCGDGVIEADEECDDGVATAACSGTCQLTYSSQRCAVTFVASGTGTLGGVQFGVDYSDAFGEFQGEGVNVDCSEALEGSFTAVEDVDAGQQLNLALLNPGGLELPADLWTCTFVTSGAALATSNFHYVDVSATDVEAKPKTVSISATVAACVYGPYCGDDIVDPQETCDDGNTTAGDCCSSTCAFESTAVVCRAAAGACDAPENCTGSTSFCPADARRTTTCRASAGACDLAEVCNGTSVSCPADARSTSVCRPSSGFCDVAETCTGAATTCPANQFTAPGTLCDDGNANTSGDQCVGGICVGTGGPSVCGDANANGTIQSSDALQILKSAVGTPGLCAPQRCDTDNSGSISSSDALRVLKKAVGQSISLNCPA